MTQKNCHTCKGVYTENQKKFYCNITGKKPNDANLLLKWYEDHEVSKPDLPCKDYAESISKQDAKHTPAGHASHDPYGYYDNLCGFLENYFGWSNYNALKRIDSYKNFHRSKLPLELVRLGIKGYDLLLIYYDWHIYEAKILNYIRYEFDPIANPKLVQSPNGQDNWTPCKRVA